MKKKLNEIENPFDWSRPVINIDEFAGRDTEVDIIENIFDEVKIGKGLNLAIFGERATGKSSLLNLIKSRINSKDGLAVKINLNETIIKNDLDFLVNMFNTVIEEGVNKGLLGGETSKDYKNWRKNIDTLNVTDDGSEYFKIGSMFASAKREKIELNILPSVIERDFSNLLKSAKQSNFSFICILLDEADVFQHNRGLLELLRNVIQELTNIIFVLAGTNNMFSYLNEVFSPIPRQFKKLKLNNFKNITETLECIFKPIESQGIKNYVIAEQIEFNTIKQIHDRTAGNPYHIKLLSYFMFEHYKKNTEHNAKMSINTSVLESVFNNISTHVHSENRKIHKTLSNCNDDALGKLAFLALYSGLTLREASILSNTFKTIETKTQKDFISNLFRYYSEVESLGIIKLENINEKENDYNADKIINSQILWDNYNIVFCGDSLDKLYFDYFVDNKITKVRYFDINASYEERLFRKLIIDLGIKYVSILEDNFEKINNDSFILCGLNMGNNVELDESIKLDLLLSIEEIVKCLNNNKNLDTAFKLFGELQLDDLINNYIGWDFCNIIQINGSVNNKNFYIRIYKSLNYSIKSSSIYKLKIKENFIDDWRPDDFVISNYISDENEENLADYNIKIDKIQSVCFNSDIIEKLANLNYKEKNSLLYDYVGSGYYEQAYQSSKFICSLTKSYTDLNNFGFVQLLLKDYDDASNTFLDVLKENRNYYTSIFNLGYLYYLKGDYNRAEDNFKEVLKLTKKLDNNEGICYFLKIPFLPYNEIDNFNVEHDLLSSINISVASLIALVILCSNKSKKPNRNYYIQLLEREIGNNCIFYRTKLYSMKLLNEVDHFQEILREYKNSFDEKLLSKEQYEYDILYFTK